MKVIFTKNTYNDFQRHRDYLRSSSFSMPIFVLFHHRTHMAAYVATTYFFFDRF